MPTSTDQPNVLLILCDQLRHDWLGYRGASFVRTPNIDAIAARGMVFTQATCNSPVCAPARIGLATGVRPHRMGSMNNHSFLPLSRQTYYVALRDRAYHVGCCGKLDLAKPAGYNGMDGDRPWTYAWGFTHPHECEGKMHAGRGNPPNGPYTRWLHEQDPALHQAFCEDYASRKGGGAVKVLSPSVLPKEYFEDVYIGRTSCRMIEELPQDFPWHFFVSFVGPHNPFDPPAEYYEQYRDSDMPPAIPSQPDGKPETYAYPHGPANEEQILEARRLYAAYITCLDDQVGEILNALERRGELDNTYIVFAADHGEMLGDHGRWTKGVQYESSLRVPMAISGPGISPGESDAIVELSDLAPTILEMCDVPVPHDIDARSLLPLLSGEREQHREYAMATHYGHGCVRTPQWKAIINENGQRELYDLENDPGEQVNLVDDRPEVFREMEVQYWHEWFGSPNQ